MAAKFRVISNFEAEYEMTYYCFWKWMAGRRGNEKAISTQPEGDNIISAEVLEIGNKTARNLVEVAATIINGEMLITKICVINIKKIIECHHLKWNQYCGLVFVAENAWYEASINNQVYGSSYCVKLWNLKYQHVCYQNALFKCWP